MKQNDSFVIILFSSLLLVGPCRCGETAPSRCPPSWQIRSVILVSRIPLVVWIALTLLFSLHLFAASVSFSKHSLPLAFATPHFLLVCCLLSKCSFWVHVSPLSSHSWPFSCHLLLPLSSLSTPFVRRDFIYSYGFVVNKRMISKPLALSWTFNQQATWQPLMDVPNSKYSKLNLTPPYPPSLPLLCSLNKWIGAVLIHCLSPRNHLFCVLFINASIPRFCHSCYLISLEFAQLYSPASELFFFKPSPPLTWIIATNS